MKKLTFQIAAVAFMAAGMLFTSCSKEGPEGPAGPAGAAGPSGAQGPAGAKGDPGTANVIYSQWLDVTFDEGIAEIEAQELTADILDGGDIKVYWNAGTAAQPLVVPVPCVFPVGFLVNDPEEGQPDIYIDPYYMVGLITLFSNYDLTTTTGGASRFRYILIPGEVQAGRKAAQEVDWNDYNAVKKYLNLKD